MNKRKIIDNKNKNSSIKRFKYDSDDYDSEYDQCSNDYLPKMSIYRYKHGDTYRG